MPHDHSPPTDPLHDFIALVADAPAPNREAQARTLASFDRGGAVAELAGWVAAWRERAVVRRPIVALYASSLANVADGPALARARLEHLAQGGGAVNRFARAQGAGVEVFDLALDRPVQDVTERAAASTREVAATIAFGMEAVAKQPDLLILGDLTAGADRAAAVLIAALAGLQAEAVALPQDVEWTRAALDRARSRSPASVLDWMAELGGREVAALMGAILAARVQGVPVLLDSTAALAAALALSSIAPDGVAHVLAAGTSAHPAHGAALAALELTPVVGHVSELGEGVAGLAALAMLRLAAED